MRSSEDMKGRIFAPRGFIGRSKEIDGITDKFASVNMRSPIQNSRSFNTQRSFTGFDRSRTSAPTYFSSSSVRNCSTVPITSFRTSEDWTILKPRNYALEDNLFNASSKVTTGINFDNFDKIPVTVSDDSITPLEGTFEDLNLPPFLISNIQSLNYSKFTPVQRYALPIVNGERDLISIAQTGSGKTAAFLIPILAKIFANGRYDVNPKYACQPKALIVVPTRELATQIFNEAVKLTYRSCIVPSMVYGGVSYQAQISRWRSKSSHIVVGTPGRLVDMISRGELELSQCRYLVFDEADNMLNMGFAPQIEAIVYESGLPQKGERQTLMFSATFAKLVHAIADKYLHRQVKLEVGIVGSASDNITQSVKWVDQPQKFDELVKLVVDTDELVLVFVEQKVTVNSVEYSLRSLGIQVVGIHGDRTQEEREAALKCFRQKKCKVMVATSVAARGLDIPNIEHVINFDFPSNFDDYVHRIGRTGRAGNLGRATSFFNRDDEKHASDLIKVLSENNQEVPDWLERIKSFSSFAPSRTQRDTSRVSGGMSGFSRNTGGRNFGNQRFPDRGFDNRNFGNPVQHNFSGNSDKRFFAGSFKNNQSHPPRRNNPSQQDSWWES